MLLLLLLPLLLFFHLFICSWVACAASFRPAAPQSLVPTITCTSSNVLHTVLQAFSQVSPSILTPASAGSERSRCSVLARRGFAETRWAEKLFAY